jgi:hypothetical protein
MITTQTLFDLQKLRRAMPWPGAGALAFYTTKDILEKTTRRPHGAK